MYWPFYISWMSGMFFLKMESVVKLFLNPGWKCSFYVQPLPPCYLLVTYFIPHTGSRRIKEADDERKAVVKLKHIKPILKLHKIEEKKNAKRRSKGGSRISVNSGSQHWKGTNQNPNKALKPNSSIALVSTDRFQAVKWVFFKSFYLFLSTNYESFTSKWKFCQ